MGENYTADEYRDVLKAIYYMGSAERKNVFGVSELVGGYVKDFSVSEIIGKYCAYINTPKTGEYWKRKESGEMVVVQYVDVEKSVVRAYCCDNGNINFYSLKYFINNFTKTEHKSRYLADFLNEMKEVSK